ncbi:MAG: hypothetical protein D6706_17770, partial [Chloroflexi bacterium]
MFFGRKSPETPHELERYLREQNAGLVERIEEKARKYAIANRANGFRVVGPDDPGMSNEERAEGITDVLGARYGKTFPIPAFTNAWVVRGQIENGQLVPWMMVDEDEGVVGTSSLVGMSPAQRRSALRAGGQVTLEFGRTAKKPGEDGARLTYPMMERAVYAYRNLAPYYTTVQSDLRAAAGRWLPNGEFLPGGGATQHINQECGLKPWAVYAPYVFRHGDEDEGVSETMVFSGRHLDGEGAKRYYEENPPWFPDFGPGLAFVRAALAFADYDPGDLKVVRRQITSPVPPRFAVENNGVYWEAKPTRSGSGLGLDKMRSMLTSKAPAMVVKVPATEEFGPTMSEMVRSGFLPTGLIPGLRTQTLDVDERELVPVEFPHQAVFTINRPGALKGAPDMEVPIEHMDTDLGVSAIKLWNEMRTQFGD